MAKAKKEVDHSLLITEFIKKLEPPFNEVGEALRQIILCAGKEVGEQIKWNAPCFIYTGEMKPFDPKEYKRDIVVFNVYKKNHILLVFPSGAKVKDTTGVLEGDYKDGRRLAKIHDMNDLKAKEKVLQKVIKEWLKLVDK